MRAKRVGWFIGMFSLGLFSVLAVQASEPVTATEEAAVEFMPPEPVVKAMEPWVKKGVTIKSYFEGPAGLVGIAGEIATGKPLVFFMDPEGTVLFSGVAIDLKSGKNLTMEAGRKYLQDIPVPDDNEEEVAFAVSELLELSSITEGTPGTGTILYAFVDFRCHHCIRFYEIVQDLQRTNSFQVNWIPMAIGGDVSETLGAYSLGGNTSTDDIRALFEVGKNPNDMAGLSVLLEDKRRIVRGSLMIEPNLEFVHRYDIHSSPYLVRVSGENISVFEAGMEKEALEKWLKR